MKDFVAAWTKVMNARPLRPCLIAARIRGHADAPRRQKPPGGSCTARKPRSDCSPD